jgi:ribosomal protein L11 methyltransferase
MAAAARKKQIPHPLYRLSIPFRKKLDGAKAQRIADALEDLAVSVFLHNRESTDGDDWTVTLTTLGPPDKAEIARRLADIARGEKPALRAVKLPETDWLAQVHRDFPPVTVGRFFIRGSHVAAPTPKKLIPLHIDAATAFGSGEHQTTKACLRAFELLAGKEKFGNALDMGCGSGILGIAIAKIWPKCKITAIDIDPESVKVTKRHAKMNKVRLQAAAGDGYAAALAKKNAPYDLIAANILAGPLIDMAPAARRALKRGGACVLSGLLKRQKAGVVKAYEKQGFTLVRAIPVGEWLALVLRRK